MKWALIRKDLDDAWGSAGLAILFLLCATLGFSSWFRPLSAETLTGIRLWMTLGKLLLLGGFLMVMVVGRKVLQPEIRGDVRRFLLALPLGPLQWLLSKLFVVALFLVILCLTFLLIFAGNDQADFFIPQSALLFQIVARFSSYLLFLACAGTFAFLWAGLEVSLVFALLGLWVFLLRSSLGRWSPFALVDFRLVPLERGAPWGESVGVTLLLSLLLVGFTHVALTWRSGALVELFRSRLPKPLKLTMSSALVMGLSVALTGNVRAFVDLSSGDEKAFERRGNGLTVKVEEWDLHSDGAAAHEFGASLFSALQDAVGVLSLSSSAMVNVTLEKGAMPTLTSFPPKQDIDATFPTREMGKDDALFLAELLGRVSGPPPAGATDAQRWLLDGYGLLWATERWGMSSTVERLVERRAGVAWRFLGKTKGDLVSGWGGVSSGVGPCLASSLAYVGLREARELLGREPFARLVREISAAGIWRRLRHGEEGLADFLPPGFAPRLEAAWRLSLEAAAARRPELAQGVEGFELQWRERPGSRHKGLRLELSKPLPGAVLLSYENRFHLIGKKADIAREPLPADAATFWTAHAPERETIHSFAVALWSDELQCEIQSPWKTVEAQP